MLLLLQRLAVPRLKLDTFHSLAGGRLGPGSYSGLAVAVARGALVLVGGGSHLVELLIQGLGQH
jgi:hypothetical protein